MTGARSKTVAFIVLASVMFGVNIRGYDVWPADEPRFAQVSREMMQSGNYLSPHINGQPYNEKPPLLFWCIALVSQPFGDVSSATARVPSVLAGMLVLFVTWALARSLYDGRVAFWSVAVLATCWRFWWQARTAQIDMLLTACLSLALLMFRLWYKDRKPGYLIAFYLAIAAGLYAKGPPALVFTLLPIFTFFWRDREGRKSTHWFIGSLASIALIALWLIPARLAVAGVVTAEPAGDIGANLFRQTIGRFFLGVSHAQPLWYYLQNLPIDWLPWTLFFPYTIWYVWKRRREGEEMRVLLAWTVPAFIFFSISFGKRQIYLLPIFPAIAILIARSTLDFIQSERDGARRFTAGVWAGILFIIAAAPMFLRFTEYKEAWYFGLSVFSGVTAFLAGHAASLAFRPGRSNRLHVAMTAQTLMLYALVAVIILPTANPYLSARDFCAPMRALNDTETGYSIYSVGFSSEEYIFHADHFHEPLLTELLDVQLPQSHADVDPAELQGGLRGAFINAAGDVPVKTFETLTASELDALKEAVDAAYAESGLQPDLLDAFIDALTDELAPLHNHLDARTRTFVMVQEEDWRWILALFPRLGDYHLLKHGAIGSRDMLLLANDAARQALGRRPG